MEDMQYGRLQIQERMERLVGIQTNPSKTFDGNSTEIPLDGVLCNILFTTKVFRRGVNINRTCSLKSAGVFTVPESGLFLASVNGVATFKIDSSVYPGNFYSYSHSSISSMYLNKGEHSIFISTQFDIRRDGILNHQCRTYFSLYILCLK